MKGGPIAWFAQNSVAANLLLIIMVVGGAVTLPTMPQKMFPDIDYNIISVNVVYLGAAPEEVEEGVCVRVEEALEGTEGIEKISSDANEGLCSVTVELYESADASSVLGNVKNKLDAIDTFPEETEKPIITLVTPQRTVMDIAITGLSDEREIKVIGQRVRDEIAALPNVTNVDLSATRPYEISIEVSEAALRKYGLSFDQVALAIRKASLDLPGGSIKTGDGEILLRTKGQAYWGPDFEKLVVLTQRDGTRVYLDDLAVVVDGFADTDEKMWFDNQPSALVRIWRVGDQDVFAISDQVKDYLQDAEARLPQGVSLKVWSDNSLMVRDRVDTLVDSARQGFLLVLLLLACFLRPRLSFWVSAGVPVAFLGAIFLAGTLGLSIDGITTFGFILVLGILVDDAVVVGERIYALQYRDTDNPSRDNLLESAIQGTREVSVPVIFGVLTTVTAFFPLIFGPGSIGQIQFFIAAVVMCCLAFSLIESQLVLPAHLGHRKVETAAGEVGLMLLPLLLLIAIEIAWSLRSFIALLIMFASGLYAWHVQGGFNQFASQLIDWQKRFSDAAQELIQTKFRQLVESAIDYRRSTVAGALAIFITTVGALAGGHLGFSFFPAVPSDMVIARLTMPLGTPPEQTEEIVSHISDSAERLRRELAIEEGETSPVINVLSAIGGHPVSGSEPGPIFVPGGFSGSHLGEVTMQLTSGEDRKASTIEITRRWRALVGLIPGAEELAFDSSSFGVGAEINIQLQGPYLDELKEVAIKIRNKLAEYPGVIDISDSFRAGKGELQLAILPAGEALGLSLGDLAHQVRQAFYGEEVQRIQRGRDDVRVMLRYTESERRTLDSLDRMRIRTQDGSEVPFYTVATAKMGTGFSTIKRTDGRRVVNVTADVDRSLVTGNEIIGNLTAGPLELILRDHPLVSYELEGQQQEQGETADSLVPMFVIALFVIYSLLAIPLKSYGQPLIIMSVIPFAFVGSVWGHILMKGFGLLDSMAIMSVMGIIAASGVVVNSSLVLVHGVNSRRAEGLAVREAVVEAAVSRCRPIVLTSLTTFAGLLPLLMNKSPQAGVLVPMATSVAFGVLLATFITLFVVPAGYTILDSLGKRIERDTATKLESSLP